MSRSTSNRKKHRDDFVNELRINISLILSAARKRNGWTQGELSDHTENVVCQEPILNYATGVSLHSLRKDYYRFFLSNNYYFKEYNYLWLTFSNLRLFHF